ncbi:MAG: phage minor tail U family protein [Alphaproteobacteria bacterium]|nr:phage minor tail U family protein [Alphaproteobacteria bacterium]|tara:strand:- start:905 stop:1348 length:444 start_codon:yes stop_codon:yes gene_type:complete
MKHARTQIRNAVTALLKGNTAAGNNVYEARVYPINDPKLPALLIYTKQEVVGEQSMSRPRTQQRELMLSVEAYVKARGNVDEVTDDLALEIEQLIAADPTLGGLVKDIALEITETQFSDDGEKPVAVAILTFSTLYAVKENAPHTLV